MHPKAEASPEELRAMRVQARKQAEVTSWDSIFEAVYQTTGGSLT
jgi:hypothetical protein